MHTGHGQVVLLGVSKNTLAGFDGFFLVHVVVGIDFRMVNLEGVSVHQIANDQQFSFLENGMARSVSYGIHGDDIVGESVAKGE